MALGTTVIKTSSRVMRLLLVTARRTAKARWVCHSCRGIKHVSQTSPRADNFKYTSSSIASQQLRKVGPARTRFAPSPTGFLHLGSLRTALFNYLVAKATGGQFLLRIEDTDQQRTIQGAEERLFEDLEWAGIEWDEGPKIGGPKGPYKQSERTAIYRDHAEKLLQNGAAYRCFCSPERLHALAEHRSKLGLPADYDRTCAHIPREESDDKAAKGHAHVIRLKVPDNYPVFNDLVYGHVRSRKETRLKPLPQGSAKGSFDDPIIMKTDGFPTYHLANVVDDHLMDITHVIRGSEWMSSTPKHLALYQAFNWQPPLFAHVGLLLDKNRQKLSKRNAAIDIRSWRDRGIFPETLTNFVALLGWSHNTGQDVMSMEDLIHNASMKYTRGDTIVGFEKLPFLQKRHAGRYASSPPSSNPLHDLRNLATKPMVDLLEKRLLDEELPFYATFRTPKAKEDYVHRILIADAANYKYPGDFIDRNLYFFIAPSVPQLRNTLPSFRLRAVPVFIPPSPDMNLFFQLLSQIRDTPDEEWNGKVLREKVSWVIETGKETSMRDLGMESLEDEGLEKRVRGAWSKLVHGYFRWALVGGNPGPDGVEMMCIIGREECERRLGVAEGLAKAMEADRFESDEAKTIRDERATEAKGKGEDLDY